jgi:glycerophosphoryl diester phosphodiesterase
LATVPEVLAAVSRHRTCRLVIEVKPVEDHTTALRTVRALDAALGSGPFSGVNLTISSFDQVLLGLVRSRIGGGEVRTALLGHEAEPAHSVLRRAVSGGHDDAHLNVAALERAPHVVTLAHHLGVGVTAWTVNRRDDLRRVVRWGVDGVITDNIVAARVLVGEAAEASSAHVARGAAC